MSKLRSIVELRVFYGIRFLVIVFYSSFLFYYTNYFQVFIRFIFSDIYCHTSTVFIYSLFIGILPGGQEKRDCPNTRLNFEHSFSIFQSNLLYSQNHIKYFSYRIFLKLCKEKCKEFQRKKCILIKSNFY